MGKAAMQLEHGYKTAQIFLVHPDDLLVDFTVLGRVKEAPTKAETESLAQNILLNGQIQPATVRRLSDGRMQLIAGRNRWFAVKHLVENGHEEARLQVKVFTGNEEDAFRMTVDENRKRKDTNPIDDAYNQKRWREVYGKSDKKIAEIYECSQAQVSQMRKLLTLSKKYQNMIINGRMPTSAAFELVKLDSDEERDELFALISQDIPEDGRIGLSQTRAAVRKRQQEKYSEQVEEAAPEVSQSVEDGGPKPDKTSGTDKAGKDQKPEPEVQPAKPTKPAPRTVSQDMKSIREFWQVNAVAADMPKGAREFSEKMIAWLEGKLPDNKMADELAALFE